MENTKLKIIDYILAYDKNRVEDFGNTKETLARELKIHAGEIKEALNELFVEKKIVVKLSTAGKLIFINYKNFEQ